MTVKNFTVTQKAGAVLTSFALAATLVGCGNTNSEEEVAQAPTEEVKPEVKSENTEAVTPEVSKEEASSAVEQAITVMIEGTEELSAASEEATQTESFQNAYDQAKQNFVDLKGFCFDGEEIAGYTASEVGDKTVDFAFDALVSTGDFFGIDVPSNPEEAKEALKDVASWLEDKGTDFGAWAMNKGSELKEKTLQKYYDKYGGN